MNEGTVGYGDVTPETKLEIFAVTIIILITAIMFAYTIMQVGNIFSDMFK